MFKTGVSLIGDDQQVSAEQRQNRVSKSRKRRMVVDLADYFGARPFRYVENKKSRIKPAGVGAVGTLGVDVGVVDAMAAIEARMAHGRWSTVAFADAGNPPTPDLFRMRGVFHVHDHVELVVQRVTRLKIGRAG